MNTVQNDKLVMFVIQIKYTQYNTSFEWIARANAVTSNEMIQTAYRSMITVRHVLLSIFKEIL